MYQNKILQEKCDCQVLSEDLQLFLIANKANCKTYKGISGKIKKLIRIAFSIYKLVLS